MSIKNPKIDSYILNAAEFARPILIHFRELVHFVCPDVEEKIKWSFPHYDYKGEMMCSMAAFKQHCAITFWKASLMKDAGKLKGSNLEAMGHYGRIMSLKDLPSDKIIMSHIREAMKLNEKGIKIERKTKTPEIKKIVVPEVLIKALEKNKKAKAVFENFSPSHKREYISWILEAKTTETQNKRTSTTISWLEEGKTRNWKYMKK
jgi:uncharacterized protein YdeI (YjbR/CyaY-like superfamily)